MSDTPMTDALDDELAKLVRKSDRDDYMVGFAAVTEMVNHARQLERELTAAHAEREGFVLVPLEPTKEMLDAYKYWHNTGRGYMDVSVYKAMIQAYLGAAIDSSREKP